MDFSPDNTIVANPPKTVNRGNTAYKLEPDLAKTWICDGAQILDIDLVGKTYNRVEIPPQFQGKNIGDGPLPFLFGMTAKKLKERYILELGSMNDPQKIIHIIAIPLHPTEQREYQRAEVLLDPVEYLPKGVQLLDPTGNRTTVYVFTAHEKPWTPWIPSPFSPPMFGLQELHNTQSNGQALEKTAEKPGGVLFK
jgi:TIGR03009 family protein